MSTDSFGKLMEKFGNEAETEKLAEARLNARKLRNAKIRKVIFLLILVGASVGCWMKRDIVSAKAMEVYNATIGKADSVKKHGEETKNKAAELKADATKRNDTLNEILK